MERTLTTEQLSDLQTECACIEVEHSHLMHLSRFRGIGAVLAVVTCAKNRSGRITVTQARSSPLHVCACFDLSPTSIRQDQLDNRVLLKIAKSDHFAGIRLIDPCQRFGDRAESASRPPSLPQYSTITRVPRCSRLPFDPLTHSCCNALTLSPFSHLWFLVKWPNVRKVDTASTTAAAPLRKADRNRQASA